MLIKFLATAGFSSLGYDKKCLWFTRLMSFCPIRQLKAWLSCYPFHPAIPLADSGTCHQAGLRLKY